MPSLPLRERLAIRRFWRWLFLLVSYYFVYHSLKDLSLFPHRFSRSAYRLFPKSECKDRAFLFPYQIFLLLFFIFFFTQIYKILITTQLYLNIFLPHTHSFWRELQIYSQNPLLANLFPCSLTSLYNISTPSLPHPLLTPTHIPYKPPRSSNSPKNKTINTQPNLHLENFYPPPHTIKICHTRP
mgnify:CR=1 FL=1